MLAYFNWYYSDGLRSFLIIFKRYIKFFWYFFSVGFLIKNLLTPWKRDIKFANWRGLHPILFLQKILENGISRIIGGIIRVATIIIGLVFMAVFIVLGLYILILWLILPLALILSLATVIFSGSLIDKIIFSATILLSFLVIFISAYGFKNSKKADFSGRDILNLANKEWFKKVWNRMGFLEENQAIKNYFSDEKMLDAALNGIGLSLKSFYRIIDWEGRREKEIEDKKTFWSEENLFSIRPIGRNWSYGYTTQLDKYSIDLQNNLRLIYEESDLVGHQNKGQIVETILSRPDQNSVFLVGDPGVGKKTFIYYLAKRIHEQTTNSLLDNKRMVELDLKELISKTSREELDAKLNKVFYQAAFAGNVIVIIHNINEFLNPSDPRLNINSVLVEYLAIPNFQIIGTLSKQAFHSYVEKNQGIMKNVDKVIFEELSKEETVQSLLYYLKENEKERVLVTYQALEKVVNLSEQYINDSPFPEKAIDSLEQVLLTWVQNPKNYLLTGSDVDEFFSRKFNVPVGKIGEAEKEKLLNLEEILHQRVIGQDKAINQISEAMRRVRSGISDKNKPIGSFLFLGSTGVGKTETAKALAEAYFGSEDRMIRIDMSEYQNAESINRFLGSEISKEPSQIIVKISENPFSVLLLDEIEKAYPEILNLFLQILDEGWLTDVFGKKAYFKNSIIIATSNAGAEIIKSEAAAGTPNKEILKKVINDSTKKGIFRAEFLNRFEGIILFENLREDELVEATKLILGNIADRIYETKNITVTFGDDFIAKLIQVGYDPIFGMRSIKRFAQDKVEDLIAKKLIDGGLAGKTRINFQADLLDD